MLTGVRSGTIIDVGVLIGVRVEFVVEMMTDTLARLSADTVTSAVTDVGVDLRTAVSVKNVVSGVMTALGVSMLPVL